MDHAGRDEDEGAGAEDEVLLVERDAELALEDVESVGVMAVDVPLRSVLVGRVAKLGEDELVAVGQEGVALGAFALSGGEQDGGVGHGRTVSRDWRAGR